MQINKSLHRAVFLDRDGVINKALPWIKDKEIPDRKHYCLSTEQFELIDGVIEAIQMFKDNKYKVLVVSNQSCISKNMEGYDNRPVGYEYEVEMIMRHMQSLLGKSFAGGWYYCPHIKDDDCFCRKPQPGLLYKAAIEHNICREGSWMVGDMISDIQAGVAAKCKTALVSKPGIYMQGVNVYGTNLLEIAKQIRDLDNESGIKKPQTIRGYIQE